jgi:hypothetical protein
MPAFQYPMGLPGRVPGEGCFVRHGYACENTPYYPGAWHTGENWFLIDGNSAGAPVYAVADGAVVFAGAEYPGRVVIVRHADDLFSMYGHLAYDLAVEEGESVERGQLLGTVLARIDEPARSHLHFEIRTFLTTTEVNGDAPRYDYACGYRCPPGPGYWPMDAPEHPSALGWRNPVHVIARRSYPDGKPPAGAVVVVNDRPGDAMALWSAPAGIEGARQVGEVELLVGDAYRLLSIDAGEEATEGTSAEAYRLWYRIVLPDGGRAWVQAAVPSSVETGSDGRPSAVRLDVIPA